LYFVRVKPYRDKKVDVFITFSWQNLVDMVIDGGYGDNVGSTIIDLSGEEPTVLREGKGSLDIL
jgi:tRNA A37 threonylcarbamoyladenosine synthetase subunit TsaC/SUA5/YrdC